MSGAEIVKPPPTVLAAPTDEAGQVLQSIMSAAKDPQVSVEKLERLFALHKEMRADQSRTSYKAALARVQAKLPRIAKAGHALVEKEGRVVRDTPFARYEDIDLAVRPLLAGEGFAVSFNTRAGNGITVFVCELSHCEGHSEERSLPLPVDATGGKNAIQAMGSSVTYAKRYLLGMHLNIVTVGEDDDGAGGSPIVSPNTAETIRAALEAAGGDAARFLKYMGVGGFEAIVEKDLPKARTFIADLKRGR